MFGCNLYGFAHWGGWFSGVFFLAAITLIVWLLIRVRRNRPINTDRSDSLEILKIRLAKGEISLEEFNILKKAL